MNLAFDLDGTLVETRAANLAAYRSIGLEPPEDFWIVPWEIWCSHSDHERKQDALPKLLQQYGRLLPAAHILLRCGGTILTNASLRTVQTIHAVYPELVQYPIMHGLNYNRKLDFLKSSAPGVYWDDQHEFIQRVRKETLWQAVNVSGL